MRRLVRPAAGPAPRVRLVLLALVSLCVAPLAATAAPRVYRDRVEPHWFAGGNRFWYRNELPGNTREFILVDARRGTREPAFDHARVAATLSKATGRTVAADKLPVDSLEFDEAGGAVVLGGGADGAWRLDLASYELRRAEGREGDGPPVLAPIGRPRPSRDGGGETAVTFENRTAGPVDVFWLDAGGGRQRYATVPPGERHEQHTFAGHVWLAVDGDGEVLGAFQATERPATAVVGRRPAGAAPTTGPTTGPDDDADRAAQRRRGRGRRGGAGVSQGPRSPDGKWLVSVKDSNLWLRNRETSEEVRLSDDGRADDAYDAAETWWSPDSSKVVAMRTEPAQAHPLHRIESSPRDQVQPKLHTSDYLKPGDRIAHPRPRLFDVAARRQVPVKDELFPTPWSIQRVRWAADSSRFTFVYNQRGHQVLRVVAVDAATGEARAIVEERSETYIDYSGKFYCEWLGDDELLWMSERDGWNHLWLYDAKAGRVKNQVTRGEWVVQGVARLDAERRQVLFTAGGVRPGQDPYYTHVCRANLDGSGFTILTEGDGTHTIRWGPGDLFFLDTWSRVDQPPVTELRSGEDGRLVRRLEEADAGELLSARGGRWPERFTAKGRDGRTDIYGYILYPRDFDPDKKYPVVEEVYAGPQSFHTPKAFRRGVGRAQEVANLGMIVVQSDGMGTSGRGKRFHDVCWKNLKDAGFPDRIAWIKAAAAARPQMDLTRVGIFGGSAGGQNAMAALLWHNDFYKVAVADCGCHDNRMDKIWWNEQWMGWPIDASYEASSNVVHAGLLKGKLMLIVGELDENVDPASTMQVVNALEKADKDFDLVVMTGVGHGAAGTPYGFRRMSRFLVRNLVDAK